MTARNDSTGDLLQTRPLVGESKLNYDSGYELAFGTKETPVDSNQPTEDNLMEVTHNDDGTITNDVATFVLVNGEWCAQSSPTPVEINEEVCI